MADETPKSSSTGAKANTSSASSSSRASSSGGYTGGSSGMGSNGKLIGLGVIAVIGWLLAAYFGISQSRLEDDMARAAEQADARVVAIETQLTEQRELAGTVDELTARRDALGPEIAELEEERTGVEGELGTLRPQVEELLAQRAALQEDISEAQQDLERLTAEAEPLREEIAGFETRTAELQDEIATQTEELSQIGQRLEDGRIQEAALRETIARLSEDSARLSQEAADAEARLQSSIQREAELREETAELDQAVTALANRRVALQDELDLLTDRRDAAVADLADARAQREDLMALVANLAGEVENRAQTLRMIEERLAALARGESLAATDTPSAAPAGDIDGLVQELRRGGTLSMEMPGAQGLTGRDITDTDFTTSGEAQNAPVPAAD